MNLSDTHVTRQIGDEKTCQLDPRSQLLGLILFSLSALFLNSIPILCLYLCIPLVFLISLKQSSFIVKGIRVCLLPFFVACILLYWWGITQNPPHPGALTTVRAIMRILIFIAAGLVFMHTISVSRFISCLERMHLPFSLIFVLSIAIRFFPHMLREIEFICDNARCKGVSLRYFILHPAQASRAYLFPLVIRSLKKSDTLALAATTRGFGAPMHRTSLQKFDFKGVDYFFMSALVLICISFFWFDYYAPLLWGGV